MRSMIDWLSTPWVGTALAIVSLGVAIYFYFKAKSVSRLAFQIDEIAIIGGAAAAFPNQLEVRFGGVVVPRVTATRVVLWNAGNTTIRGDQVVEGDPLRLEVPEGCVVLRARINGKTRAANAVSVAANGNVVTVSFDYLDPNDGVNLFIYHSADRRALTCTGTLRGLSGGPDDLGTLSLNMNAWLPGLPRGLSVRSTLWIGVVVGGAVAIGGIFMDRLASFKPGDLHLGWPMVIAGSLYFFMGLLLLWATRRRHPKVLDRAGDGDEHQDDD